MCLDNASSYIFFKESLNMKKIEIYWQDLTEKAQMDILELLGDKEESHNWDTFPMAVVEIEEEND